MGGLCSMNATIRLPGDCIPCAGDGDASADLAGLKIAVDGNGVFASFFYQAVSWKTMAEQTIGDVMAGYAEAAVQEAGGEKIALDYGEESLRQLDPMLDILRPRLSAFPGDLDEACKRWGGYLGEVVRRRWGGDWTIESYPGKGFLVVTLSVAGSKIYPAMKIHRRLTSTPSEESIWSFYQMLQTRLGSRPGSGIQ